MVIVRVDFSVLFPLIELVVNRVVELKLTEPVTFATEVVVVLSGWTLVFADEDDDAITIIVAAPLATEFVELLRRIMITG